MSELDDDLARLSQYVETPEFKRRSRFVRERQDAGEDLSLQEIAAALDVPLWFAEASLEYAARQRLGREIDPGDRSRPN